MTVAPDTNVLLRIVMKDDKKQAQTALRLLERAELIAISPTCFCELAWALRSIFAIQRADIAVAIEELLTTSNIVTNRSAIEAGLQTLKAGGDFADGVLAYEGRWLGGNVFATFDKKASKLLETYGHPTLLLKSDQVI